MSIFVLIFHCVYCQNLPKLWFYVYFVFTNWHLILYKHLLQVPPTLFYNFWHPFFKKYFTLTLHLQTTAFSVCFGPYYMWTPTFFPSVNVMTSTIFTRSKQTKIFAKYICAHLYNIIMYLSLLIIQFHIRFCMF